MTTLLRNDENRALGRRAMELDRNDPRVLTNVGITLAWGLLRSGRLDLVDRHWRLIPTTHWPGVRVGRQVVLAIMTVHELLRTPLRLSPLDPRAFVAANAMASVHFLAGRYEEAISSAAKALRQHHGYPLAMQLTVRPMHWLAALKMQTNMRALSPASSKDPAVSYQKPHAFCPRRSIQKYVTGLRLAGLPE